MEAIRFHGGMRANIPRFRPGQAKRQLLFFPSQVRIELEKYSYHPQHLHRYHTVAKSIFLSNYSSKVKHDQFEAIWGHLRPYFGDQNGPKSKKKFLNKKSCFATVCTELLNRLCDAFKNGNFCLLFQKWPHWLSRNWIHSEEMTENVTEFFWLFA